MAETEYRPTEYAVDFGDYRSNRFVELSMALIEHNGAKLHEPIVRCRDCKYAEIDQSDHEYREPLWCDFHRMDVKPGNFCAWGKRKGADE